MSYLDGAFMSTVSDNTICTTQNTSDFCIGMNRPGDTAARYQGALDDLRIYNRALSKNEIQELSK